MCRNWCRYTAISKFDDNCVEKCDERYFAHETCQDNYYCLDDLLPSSSKLNRDGKSNI